MKKFETGKTYASRAICDYNCIFEVKILKRTKSMVSYLYDGVERRSKIRFDDDGNEYIVPDNYSMAPSFRAN